MFLEGEIFIIDGIAFYVDPDNQQMAYAASPSESDTIERLNLVTSEAIRVLPFFLADCPEFCEHLRGRELAVRLIDNYSNAQTSIRKEHLISWNILDEMLVDSEEVLK